MHRPPFNRRSSRAPQLCVAGAIFLLLLSLSILHFRLSSSPRPLPLPFSSRSPNPNSHPLLIDDSLNDAFDGDFDDRIDTLDLLDADNNLNSDSPNDANLFWDHALGVARNSFYPKDSRSPPKEDLPMDLAFGSDDEPLDERVRAKLASIRGIEDVLLLTSVMRDGWAKWLEGKADFIRRDRMLRSNFEFLNPRNHPLLQDPDVAGFTGLTRGDRLIRRGILKEMDEADFVVRGVGRRALHLEVEREDKQGVIDSRVTFSEFVDQFLGAGQCSLRVFMVWNSPSWSFGVRHRRGLESLLYHHRNACVLYFSETFEPDFFKDFVRDG